MRARAASAGGRNRNELPAVPIASRLAALLLDWAVGCALAVFLAIVVWLWWLGWSHGGTQQPSDFAIYAGLIILSAAVPLWAIGSVVFLARWGQTPGLAAFALRVAAGNGMPPPPLRALARVAALGFFGSAVAVTPVIAVGVTAAAVQHTLPAVVAVVAAVPPVLGVAEIVCYLVRRDRRALHDLLTGTRVLRAERP